MNRRKFVTTTTAAAAATILTKAHASGSHHHAKVIATLDKNKKKALIDSTNECIEDGQACISHCVAMLSSGDKSMAECFNSVQNMLAACTALNKMANLNSAKKSDLIAFANACASVCETCAESCKKHAGNHKECKACLESCLKCIKICKSIA